ncbi:hypothetical protein [Cellvibrio sp. QJXJ]|uniref:hypothetical protein n=1 Tax=Cellvibrio sp. QJXJ TaxID=2964606 RepID=UPI0021C3DE31|nr:hypothetical protein [Cellvibrio sp. QJXJ]UUA74951.1 hypothetical protein NNX04_21055 [Cellvibrio sp. QJXJ]
MTMIPNSVMSTVASVLSQYYVSHSKINLLFMDAGAPGDPPEGNLETKCIQWFKRCNEDEVLNPLGVLGFCIQTLMDADPSIDERISTAQHRIGDSLAKNQLGYQLNGVVTVAGAGLTTKTLADFFIRGTLRLLKQNLRVRLPTCMQTHTRPSRRRVPSSTLYVKPISIPSHWICPQSNPWLPYGGSCKSIRV